MAFCRYFRRDYIRLVTQTSVGISILTYNTIEYDICMCIYTKGYMFINDLFPPAMYNFLHQITSVALKIRIVVA